MCDVYNRDVYFLMKGYRLRDYSRKKRGHWTRYGTSCSWVFGEDEEV